MIYFTHMPPEKPDIIDINRRNFIKASLFLAGGLVLGKVSGLLSLPSNISSSVRVASAPPIRVKEYQNARYGFSLLYPSALAVSTFDEGGGASTITFQNPEKGEGFQIFSVPYGGTQAMSEERFRQDVPSGVCKSLTHIAMDGAAGTAFYSTHTALGATREVWVVHRGFLHEVTTLKPLDGWLDSIIPTLKFV